VDLERGPHSLVSIIKKLFERQSSGSGLEEPRLTAVGIRCADHATSLSAKIEANFTGSGDRSVGIVRLQAKSHEF
jgi:hypothetical protein